MLEKHTKAENLGGGPRSASGPQTDANRPIAAQSPTATPRIRQAKISRKAEMIVKILFICSPLKLKWLLPVSHPIASIPLALPSPGVQGGKLTTTSAHVATLDTGSPVTCPGIVPRRDVRMISG
jgi:hypothetical protein